MSLFKHLFTRSRLLLAMQLLLLAGFGYFLSRPIPSPPALILPLSANVPKNELPVLNRLVPYSWKWFWRLKSRFFPSTQTVVIQADIFELYNPPLSIMTNFVPHGIELANTNGILALGINSDALEKIRSHLSRRTTEEANYILPLSSPRLQAGDAAVGVLSMSGNSSSIQLRVFTRLHPDATDLTTTILITQPTSTTNPFAAQTKTNLALWAKTRIPDASGILFLDCHPGYETNRSRTAILISANLTSPAKLIAKPVSAQSKP